MKAFVKNFGWIEFTRIVFFLCVIIGTFALFIFTPSLMPSALLSVLCFFIFAPIVNALERRSISRAWAIAFLFITSGGIIGWGTSWFIPRISREIQSFQEDTNRSERDYTKKLKMQEHQLLGDIPYLAEANLTEKGIQKFKGSSQTLLSYLPDVASQLLMAFILVPFLTFILLKDSRDIERSLLRLVPNRYFETVYSLSSRIIREMGGYVSARILESILMMTMVTVSCLALKIPYAFLLGFFAGATNPIPYLGPLIGALPGVILAVLDPSIQGQLLTISMIYLVTNLVDMILVFPLVVAKIVNLHPLVVVVSVVLGSQFFGVLGMILAVPVTSILKILVGEVYDKVYPSSALK